MNKRKSARVAEGIWTLFYAVLAFCMIAYLCLASLRVNVFSSITGHGLFVLILIILAMIRRKVKWIPGKKAVIFLCSATFVTRMVHFFFAHNRVTQIMDFKTVLDKAATGDFSDKLEYYRMYLHKFLYPWLLHVFHINTQSKILFFQCLCVTFVPLMLYLLGRRVMDEWTGFLAGILYLFWPAQTIYTSIVSEEHLVALLTLVLVWLLFGLWDRIGKSETWKEKNTRTVLLMAFGIGLLCAFLAFLKDWASVILVAGVILCIPLLFGLNARKRLLLFASLLLILVARSGLQKGITAFAEHKLGVKANNGIIVDEMFETLTPGVEGQFNAELKEEYRQILIDNNYDFDKTQKEALAILGGRIKENIGMMPDLFLRKATTAYENDYAMFWWAYEMELSEEDFAYWKPSIERVNQLDQYYYLMLVTGLILTVWLVRRKECFFLLLIIQGTMMVSLLIEAQSRYKYSIEPLWTVAIACGMLYMADKIEKLPQFNKGGKGYEGAKVKDRRDKKYGTKES